MSAQKGNTACNSDHRLALSCARGDAQAWDTLVRTYQGPVYNLVLRLSGAADAEDITQEVFLRAFRALPAFRGECRLSTWLYRIAVNICRDRARARRRQPLSFSLDEPFLAEEGEVGRQLAATDNTVDEHVEARELGRQVSAALAELSPAHRAVLVLHDMQGLHYDEIAQIVGCSLGTVKSRLFYARRKMMRIMERYRA